MLLCNLAQGKIVEDEILVYLFLMRRKHLAVKIIQQRLL